MFLFSDQTLHVNKFEDADFKFDISFLKFQAKISKYYNVRPIFKRVFFARNFTFSQIKGAEVKHGNSIFSTKFKVHSTYMKLCMNLIFRA